MRSPWAEASQRSRAASPSTDVSPDYRSETEAQQGDRRVAHPATSRTRPTPLSVPACDSVACIATARITEVETRATESWCLETRSTTEPLHDRARRAATHRGVCAGRSLRFPVESLRSTPRTAPWLGSAARRARTQRAARGRRSTHEAARGSGALPKGSIAKFGMRAAGRRSRARPGTRRVSTRPVSRGRGGPVTSRWQPPLAAPARAALRARDRREIVDALGGGELADGTHDVDALARARIFERAARRARPASAISRRGASGRDEFLAGEPFQARRANHGARALAG